MRLAHGGMSLGSLPKSIFIKGSVECVVFNCNKAILVNRPLLCDFMAIAKPELLPATPLNQMAAIPK